MTGHARARAEQGIPNWPGCQSGSAGRLDRFTIGTGWLTSAAAGFCERGVVMHAEISDYALLGDTRTAALVSRDGSIDWLCAPRFDSAAFFAAMLGSHKHGRWLLAPMTAPLASRRSYRPDTMVLETEHECPEGVITVVDAMPLQ